MFPEVGKVDVNVKFPIFMEWIIDIYDGKAFPFTKNYEFPGFANFKYSLSHSGHFDEDETFDFSLSIYSDICDSYDIEVDLNFTINGKETKKIVQNIHAIKDPFIVLWDDLSEVFFDHLDKNRQIILQLSGTFTLVSFDNEFRMCLDESLIWHLQKEIEGKDKDFIIVAADGKEIEVHKLALQNQSKVFTAMFENSWKEAVEGRVVIPDFFSKIIEFAIELCYKYYANCDLDSLEYIQLFLFADKYDMEEMKECIKESIVLSPGNICEYANLYHEQKCEELLNYCIDRLIVYFQYSYPVSSMDILNNDIKIHFFERAAISKVMKKEIQFDYYKNK